MFTRIARPAMIAAAAAAAITAMPAAASAQSYGYSDRYVPGYGGQTYSQGYASSPYRSSDYCANQRSSRTGTGALVGAGAGAVVGSQLAARGRRTEGSILGGVLGAVIGGSVGRGSSERCESYSYGPAPAYGSSGYESGGYQSGGYASQGPWTSGYTAYAPAQSSQYFYDSDGYGPYAASDYGYERDDSYDADDRYDDRYDDRRMTQDQCRLAESRIRLPDGRSETRYVRTCPDSSGRYRVVD